MHRATTLAAVCAIASGAIACTQVLGLDPPLRDPCALGGCGDDASDNGVDPTSGSGSVPTHPVDAGGADTASPVPTPGPSDAGATDAAPPDAARTFRCGGPGTRLAYCDQSTQTCCAEYDAGWDYRCITETTYCPGVPITCARQSDCVTGTVCCDVDTPQSTVQSCVSRGTCTGFLVCDPNASPSECPQGYFCEPSNDPTIPYYFCK